jgi:hypothetical protein
MTTLYEVVLREGVEEARQERAFDVEKSPGDHIYIDGDDWVVVLIRERAGRTPELIAIPSGAPR